MRQIVENIGAALRRPVVWLALTLITAVIAAVVAQIINDRRAESELKKKLDPYVAVIMSTSDDTFTIPQEFLTGFNSGAEIGPIKMLNGAPVRIEQLDDTYSVEGARLLAQRLINDDNCLFIIGNSNSQLTGVTLTEILRADSGKRVPLLMPIATANRLTRIASDHGFNAVLRMVPNNKDQASRIVDYIVSRSPTRRVVILVDEENTEYSTDLAKDLNAEIREAGGAIVHQGDYGNKSRLHSVANIIRNESPDFVIFVGVSNNGLLLVDDIAAQRLDVPVIFTDGGTVHELIDRARTLPGGSYFLSAVRNEQPMSGSKLEPTYTPIGTDANKLLRSIMAQVPHPTRAAVRDYLHKERKRIILSGGLAGNYQFNASGENEAMRFNVYKSSPTGLILEKGY